MKPTSHITTVIRSLALASTLSLVNAKASPREAGHTGRFPRDPGIFSSQPTAPISTGAPIHQAAGEPEAASVSAASEASPFISTQVQLQSLAEQAAHGRETSLEDRGRAQLAFEAFGNALLLRHKTESLAELGLLDMAKHYDAAWLMSLIDPARHGGWPFRHPGLRTAYPQFRQLLEREAKPIRRAGLIIPAIENGDVDFAFTMLKTISTSDRAIANAVLGSIHAYARANGRWDNVAQQYGAAGPRYSRHAREFLDRVNAWQVANAGNDLDTLIVFLNETAGRVLTSGAPPKTNLARAKEMFANCRAVAEGAFGRSDATEAAVYRCCIAMAIIEPTQHAALPFRFPQRRATLKPLRQILEKQKNPLLSAALVIPALDDHQMELALQTMRDLQVSAPAVAGWLHQTLVAYSEYSNDAVKLTDQLGIPNPRRTALTPENGSRSWRHP